MTIVAQNKESAMVQNSMAFWNREETSRPLISFRTGTDMPFHQFRCAERIKDKPVLLPEDIVPEEFYEDYVRLAKEQEALEQDVIFGFDPFMGVPWLEAIAGCAIGTSDTSGWAHPPEMGPERWLDQEIDLKNNPWIDKLLEFRNALIEFANGKYSVTQPLFRGPSDLLHSIMGHEEAVVSLLKEPALCQKILNKCTQLFVDVLEEYNRDLPQVKKGWLIGIYNIWTPEPGCRFQEDATSLHSPSIYRDYVQPCDEAIANRWKYNMIHTHPASFYILDELLKTPSLRSVQVSIDFDNEVMEIIPQLKKMQDAGKCILLEGRFSWETMKGATEVLENKGLFYQVKTDTLEQAREFASKFYSCFS